MRTRRHYLEPIDLRTGIDPTGESEETRELQVLKVCLDEIERSRPYLIVILGDRYGWIRTQPGSKPRHKKRDLPPTSPVTASPPWKSNSACS